MKFRALLLWIHLVLGITAAIVVAVAGVTGAYITFQAPLERLFHPVPRVPSAAVPADAGALLVAVEAGFAPVKAASLELGAPGQAAKVVLRDRTIVFVDPGSGAIVEVRRWRIASVTNLTLVMRRLHTSLLIGRPGRLLVTLVTLEVVLLALTGLWLWWRKKHWRFGPWRGSLFRVSWDLHNATGVWFLLPVIIMSVTGALIYWPGPVYRAAGADPAPRLDAPSSQPAAGRDPVAFQRALHVADSLRPGVSLSGLVIPRGPAGAFAVRKGNETVYVDQFSGEPVMVRADREPTAGDEAYRVVEDMHTGALFGAGGRLVMTLGSLMLTVMAVTGTILGLKRLTILFGRRAREAD